MHGDPGGGTGFAGSSKLSELSAGTGWAAERPGPKRRQLRLCIQHLSFAFHVLRFVLEQGKSPAGYLAFTLHAHLPYVVNHGTWPHGMEWLHEAAAETYLPLLRVLGEPGARWRSCQPQHQPFAHPAGAAGHPLFHCGDSRNMSRARSSRRARMKPTSSSQARRTWPRRRGSGSASSPPRWRISTRSRGQHHRRLPPFQDAGHDRDPDLRRHARLHASAGHRRERARAGPHRGRRRIAAPGAAPRGIWAARVRIPAGRAMELPGRRCGIGGAASTASSASGWSRRCRNPASTTSSWIRTWWKSRAGRSRRMRRLLAGRPLRARERKPHDEAPQRSLYQPYYVEGPYRDNGRVATTVFPRDPRTGLQVWSGDTGYPGDANYLDFHKKRFPGGHRYWQVTGPPGGYRRQAALLAAAGGRAR